MSDARPFSVTPDPAPDASADAAPRASADAAPAPRASADAAPVRRVITGGSYNARWGITERRQNKWTKAYWSICFCFRSVTPGGITIPTPLS